MLLLLLLLWPLAIGILFVCVCFFFTRGQGRDINTGAERVEPKLKVPLWGGEVPLWAGLGFLLLVSHPLRLALWQLPCALNLHAMSPGLLARGVSPAASVADPALRSFLLSIP